MNMTLYVIFAGMVGIFCVVIDAPQLITKLACTSTAMNQQNQVAFRMMLSFVPTTSVLPVGVLAQQQAVSSLHVQSARKRFVSNMSQRWAYYYLQVDVIDGKN